MRQMKYIYPSLLIAVFFIVSCSKEEIVEKENMQETSRDSNLTVKNAIVQNDSIIPLNKEDFPEKESLISAMNYETNDAIMQLQGVEFYLQSNYFNFGLNTLETQGAGQEIELSNYQNGKEEQLFYIEYFPPSSGIQYMIYSSKENNPVSVGSYSSTPNEYVLYTKSTDGYSFGDSWDFLMSSSDEGFVIENQDILGGSGGWNIYSYALDTQNGDLTMQQTNSGQFQEFQIIPNYQFEIISIDFEYDQSQILSSIPTNIDEIEFINNGSTPVNRTSTLSETRTEETSFQEQKGISLNTSSGFDLTFGVPETVQVGGSFEVQQGSTQTITYGENSSVIRELTDQTDFVMEPYTRTRLTYTAFRQTLEVEYVATCKAIGFPLEIEIRGVWEGVDYSFRQIIREDFDLQSSSLIKSEIIDLASK